MLGTIYNFNKKLELTLFLKISGNPPIHDKCSLPGKSRKKTPHLYWLEADSHLVLFAVAEGQNLAFF